MKKNLRSVTIIEGAVGSGKSRQILNEYRKNVKSSACMLITFEENFQNKIPVEEVNAHIGNVYTPIGSFQTMDKLIVSINNSIDKHNIDHVYIDMIALGIRKLYRPDEIFKGIYQINASVTTTIQMNRTRPSAS